MKRKVTKKSKLADALGFNEWRVRDKLDATSEEKKRRRAAFDAHYADLTEYGAAMSAQGICSMLRERVSKPDEHEKIWRHNMHTLTTFAGESMSALQAVYRGGGVDLDTRLEALKGVINVLRSATFDLQQEAARLPQLKNLQTALAVSCDSWPVLMPRNNKKAKEQRVFVLKELHLAANSPFNVSGKGAGKSPEWWAALRIIQTMLAWRTSGYIGSDTDQVKQLEDPSIRTRLDWWIVAQNVVLPHCYGVKFWEHQQFRHHLGKTDHRGGFYSLEKPGALKTDIREALEGCFYACYKPFSKR